MTDERALPRPDKRPIVVNPSVHDIQRRTGRMGATSHGIEAR